MDFLTSQPSNFIWIALALVSGAMLLFPALVGASANALSPLQAVMLVNRQNALILDIRPAEEFEAGSISGARNIPFTEFESRIGELSKFKKKPMIVLCANGGARSGHAAKLLTKAGFEQVFNLAGGLNAWKAADQPVSTKKKA